MWPFRRRREQLGAPMLRDFVDLTGFSTGRGFSSTFSAHAALRRHGGWLGIGVRPIVDRLAGLQWQALNDAGEEIEKAPILDLLRSPNAMCDGGLLLRITAQSLVLAGECYLLKLRGRRSGRSVQLVPISPDRVERAWRDDGAIEYHVAPGSGAGEPEVHPAEDMIRVWRPLPSDPWEAYGAASMLVAEVQAEDGWRETVLNWFRNDARPQLALELQADDAFHSHIAPPEWWEDYSRAWIGLNKRRDGAMFGVPAPLPPGSKLRELSGLGQTENLTPTEQALRSKILSALGVPPFLLGAAHEANRASAEASLWAFDFSAVKPWAELLVCAINHQLGPDFDGQRVQFRDWVWRDRLAESEIDARLLEHFVLSPNEVREKRNLPPADWGELPVSQAQDVPYDGSPRAPVPPAATRAAPLERTVTPSASVTETAREAARLLSKGGDASEWRAALERVRAMRESELRAFRAALAARYFPEVNGDPGGAIELAYASFLIQAEAAIAEASEG